MSAAFLPAGIPLSKRLLDLILVIPGLLILSPVLLLAALLILVLDGWPVFFVQDRPGYHGISFKMVKFRTMKVSNIPLPPSADAGRLSRLGRFLRSSSIDELPELFNVLRGEMSLVGPRPLLMQYLERYSPEQARRHNVLPGIAGWAQVNGRNALTWEKKFELDVWYVDHWTLRLDLRILWLALIKTIKREGISQAGLATTEEFWGHREN